MSTETSVPTEDTMPGKDKSGVRKFAVSTAGLITGAVIAAGIIGGVIALTSTPALATNEQVSTAYNVDIIDNPNFVNKDMLKVNDEKLAELCVRPTVKDVEKMIPLDCKVLQ